MAASFAWFRLVHAEFTNVREPTRTVQVQGVESPRLRSPEAALGRSQAVTSTDNTATVIDELLTLLDPPEADGRRGVSVARSLATCPTLDRKSTRLNSSH